MPIRVSTWDNPPHLRSPIQKLSNGDLSLDSSGSRTEPPVFPSICHECLLWNYKLSAWRHGGKNSRALGDFFFLKSFVSSSMLDLERRMYLHKWPAPFKFLSKGIPQETLELFQKFRLSVVYQFYKDTSLWLLSPHVNDLIPPPILHFKREGNTPVSFTKLLLKEKD